MKNKFLLKFWIALCALLFVNIGVNAAVQTRYLNAESNNTLNSGVWSFGNSGSTNPVYTTAEKRTGNGGILISVSRSGTASFSGRVPSTSSIISSFDADAPIAHAIVWVKSNSDFTSSPADISVMGLALNSSGQMASNTNTRYAMPRGTYSINSEYQQVAMTFSRGATTATSATVLNFYLYHGTDSRSPRPTQYNVYYDDIVIYTSTSNTTDLSAPSAPSAMATQTAGPSIDWEDGTDSGTGATGVQGVLIFKRTNGSAQDLDLNNQGLYSGIEDTFGGTVTGATKDNSGNWTVAGRVAADVETFTVNTTADEVYAVVNYDLALNYSAPVYITIGGGTPKTPIDKPTLTQSSFTYDNSEKTVTLTPEDAAYSITAGDTQTNVGGYNATISLADPTSTAWSDNGSSAPFTLPWSITKATGCGTVTLDNWTEGIPPASTPNPASTCQGITGVSYSYAGAGYGPTPNQPTAAGNYTITATFPASDNYNAFTTAPVNFTILPNTTPTITVDPVTVDFEELLANTGQVTKTFTVTGTNLTGDLTLTPSGAGISISPSTLTPTGNAVNAEVSVYYTPTAAGTISGTVVVSGGGATPKTVTIIGSVKEILTAGESLVTCSDATLTWGAISDATSYTVKLCAEGGEPVETLQATYATTEFARADNGASNLVAGGVNLDPTNGPYIFEFELRTSTDFTGALAIAPYTGTNTQNTNNGFRMGLPSTDGENESIDGYQFEVVAINGTEQYVEILTNPAMVRGGDFQTYRFKITGLLQCHANLPTVSANSSVQVRNESAGVGTFYVRNLKIYTLETGESCDTKDVGNVTSISLADKFGALDPETEYTYTVTPVSSTASAFTDKFSTTACDVILENFTIKWTGGNITQPTGTTTGKIAFTSVKSEGNPSMEVYYTLSSAFEDYLVYLLNQDDIANNADGTLLGEGLDKDENASTYYPFNIVGTASWTGIVRVVKPSLLRSLSYGESDIVAEYSLTIENGVSTGQGNTPAEIVSTEYYTLTGVKLSAPTGRGVIIKKITYTNGDVKVVKTIQ